MLQEALENASLTVIEKDIVKAKLCDLYLLADKTFNDYPKPQTIEKEQSLILETETLTSSEVKIDSDDSSEHRQEKKNLFIEMDYKTLSDVFLEKEPTKQQTEDNSLFYRISQTKISDLRRSIAMNDRFIFIKELFKNDFESYNMTINELNQCETTEQAMSFLVHIKSQYEWDENNATVQHFISLINRKFI
jgi:hypothetical protein